MPQTPDFGQYIEQAMQLRALTRSQAQRITRDLVREGQLAQERAQSYVDELIERSRKRTEDLVSLVRKEVKTQIAALGIATKEDLARLETRISQVSSEASSAARATVSSPSPSPLSPPLPGVGEPDKKPAKKAGAKKAAAKKSDA